MLRIDRMRAESSDRQPGRPSAMNLNCPCKGAAGAPPASQRRVEDWPHCRLTGDSRILPGCLFDPFAGLLQILPDAAPIQVHLPD